jgi:glycosyltransferase involved in cell wall biosynthesis
VLSQDYPNIEYIIMDGGSTDETASVVKDYASRLTFVSEKDRGQAHAVNKGFRMARGKLLSWLNSDDLLLPGMIRAVVDAFEEQPNAGAVYGEGYLMDSSGQITGRFPATEPFNLWKLLHLSDYVLQQTVGFRRAVLDEVGYLDEDLHYVMDWEILIRIAKRYPLKYVPTYMGCLREYPEAKSFSGGGRRIRELRDMLRRHTGMRFPPGYITYGLATYHRIWSNRVGRFLPARFSTASTALQSAIDSAAAAVISHVSTESQGLYSDRWATRVLRYTLPPGVGSLVITGTLPDLTDVRGQKLSLYVNAQYIDEYEISPGAFQLTAALGESLQGKLLQIKVVATRWFIPDGDGRRLAYLVDAIRWSESNMKLQST